MKFTRHELNFTERGVVLRAWLDDLDAGESSLEQLERSGNDAMADEQMRRDQLQDTTENPVIAQRIKELF